MNWGWRCVGILYETQDINFCLYDLKKVLHYAYCDFGFSQVGLISDEKLVDLLDLALSADTVNTVKNLRVIMETGVEPLALMTQLATVITDVLAGSYDFTKDMHRRRFFQRQPCEYKNCFFPSFYNDK